MSDVSEKYSGKKDSLIPFIWGKNWIDPIFEKWTRNNTYLAEKFSTEVTGNNESARTYNLLIIQVVSDYLWEIHQPSPDWAKLDVDGLQHTILHTKLKLDAIAADNFNIVVTAFYTWLARKGYIAGSAAVGIIEHLREHHTEYAHNIVAKVN